MRRWTCARAPAVRAKKGTACAALDRRRSRARDRAHRRRSGAAWLGKQAGRSVVDLCDDQSRHSPSRAPSWALMPDRSQKARVGPTMLSRQMHRKRGLTRRPARRCRPQPPDDAGVGGEGSKTSTWLQRGLSRSRSASSRIRASPATASWSRTTILPSPSGPITRLRRSPRSFASTGSAWAA